MRRAARVDDNHDAVVAVLRQHGWSVISIARIGEGCPDLLVGRRGVTHLIEVKDGGKPPSARRIRPAQAAWHATWRGSPVVILESLEQASWWAREGYGSTHA